MKRLTKISVIVMLIAVAAFAAACNVSEYKIKGISFKTLSDVVGETRKVNSQYAGTGGGAAYKRYGVLYTDSDKMEKEANLYIDYLVSEAECKKTATTSYYTVDSERMPLDYELNTGDYNIRIGVSFSDNQLYILFVYLS